MTNEYLNFAHQLADCAGEIARTHFRGGAAIEIKADASPVTIADKAIEAKLREMIMATYPEHGIFGEEQTRHQPDATVQWVIDPIDGTRSFIAGYPLFTTLISLVEHNVPILGIIDQPITGERWVGVKGEKTVKVCHPVPERVVRGSDTGSRKKNLSARSAQLFNTLDPALPPSPRLRRTGQRGDIPLSSATLITTSRDYFDNDQAAWFAQLAAGVGHVVHGGDAYGYAMLAEGQVDVVLDVSMKPYDYMALVPVIEGAGGVIADFSGQPVTLESNGNIIAARSKALLDAVLATVNPDAGFSCE